VNHHPYKIITPTTAIGWLWEMGELIIMAAIVVLIVVICTIAHGSYCLGKSILSLLKLKVYKSKDITHTLDWRKMVNQFKINR
jgi:hypothetical protein